MAASSVGKTSGARHAVGSPCPATFSHVWTITRKPDVLGSNRTPPLIRIPGLRPSKGDKPLAPQHCVCFRPDPHGQGAFLPTGLIACLSGNSSRRDPTLANRASTLLTSVGHSANGIGATSVLRYHDLVSHASKALCVCYAVELLVERAHTGYRHLHSPPAERRSWHGVILERHNLSCGFTLVVCEEAPKPFATLHRACTLWVLVC